MIFICMTSEGWQCDMPSQVGRFGVQYTVSYSIQHLYFQS